MPKVTALLITSEPTLSDAVQSVVASVQNLQLQVVGAIDLANTHLYRADLGLVILHLGRRKSDADGVTRILSMGSFQRRQVAVIVISDQPNPELALMLSERGAAEFLERPLDLRRLAYLADVLTVRLRHQGPPVASYQTDAIIPLGDSNPFLFAPGTAMGQIMEKVVRVASQDTTVLLTGETGTGKSFLARLLHNLSPRSCEPFHVINCGALSANLIESEMFGHVKGAFTGADRDRTGKCKEVGRGTLVLDEVDTLTLDLQAKLLRLVEDRVFEPVGSNRPLPLEARLIVATNRNLKDEMANKRFRSDLYYRLNVVEFPLPSLRDRLRERPEVLAPLVENFFFTFAAKAGRDLQGFSPAALEILQAYSWPGNIREVRNVIERAVALCDGPFITLEDLPAEIRQEPLFAIDTVAVPRCANAPLGDRTLAQAKEEAEMACITQALAKHLYNFQCAAAELGISRMTLYNKLRRYGLTRPDGGESTGHQTSGNSLGDWS